MNENKRILLLALGILAIVASDPPVASYFERPHSACSIVTDLAVGAFDSLVRSTLPPSDLHDRPVATGSVLVASDETVSPPKAVSRVASSPRYGSAARVTAPVVMTSARRIWVQTRCSGRSETVEMVRVEASIEVRGASVRS